MIGADGALIIGEAAPETDPPRWPRAVAAPKASTLCVRNGQTKRFVWAVLRAMPAMGDSSDVRIGETNWRLGGLKLADRRANAGAGICTAGGIS
mmetsp:Transcript_56550/g.164028  ORF Transcript_56550/g.164028 Transcript_56550/m.164028 type:complete len:94 (-) Transcript_56550:806-1087(-)